jgi:hypothetical protein
MNSSDRKSEEGQNQNTCVEPHEIMLIVLGTRTVDKIEKIDSLHSPLKLE